MKLFRTMVLSSLFLVLFSSLSLAADYFDIAVPLYVCEDGLTGEEFFSTDPDCPAPLDSNTVRTDPTQLLGYIIDPMTANLPGNAVALYHCYDPTQTPKRYFINTDINCGPNQNIVQYGNGPLGYILSSTNQNDQIMKQLSDPFTFGGAFGWVHKSDPLPCSGPGEFPIDEGNVFGRSQTCTIDGNEEITVYNNLDDTFAPSKYYVNTLIITAPADGTSKLTVRHARSATSGGGENGGSGGNGENQGGRGGTGGEGGIAPSRVGALGDRGNKPSGDQRGTPGQAGGSIEIIANSVQNNGQIVLSGYDASNTGGAPNGWQEGRSGQGGSGGGAGGQLIITSRTYSQALAQGIVATGGRGGNGGRGGQDAGFNGKGEGGGGGGGAGGRGGQLLFFDGAVPNPASLSVLLTGGSPGSAGPGGAGGGQAGNVGQSGNQGTVGTHSTFAENTYLACRDGFDNDYDGNTDFDDSDCAATCPTGAAHGSVGCCGDDYLGTLTNANDRSPRYAGDCGLTGNNAGSEVLCWADATFTPPTYRDPLQAPTVNQWFVTDSVSGPGFTKGTVVPLGCDMAAAVSSGTAWELCNDPAGFNDGANRVERVDIQGEGHDYVCYKQDEVFKVSECHDGVDFTTFEDIQNGITITQEGNVIETLLNDPGFELGLESTVLNGNNVNIPYFWSTDNYPTGHMVVQSTNVRSGTSSLFAEGVRTASQRVAVEDAGDYAASVYVKVIQPGAGSASGIATLTFKANDQNSCSVSADPVVSGWQLIGCSIKSVTTQDSLSIEFSTTGSDDIYFDDVMVLPFTCGDDSTWKVDIHTDQVACDGPSEGEWTGSACCGERDDFQEDGFGETFNGGSGESACFNGQLVQEGDWPVYEDGLLKRASIGTQHSDIVNIDGSFRGCAIDETNKSGEWQGSGSNLNEVFFGSFFEDAKEVLPNGGNYISDRDNDKLLDLVDCPNPGQDDCTQNELITDYGYCHSFQVGNEQVYCSYEEKWKKSFDLDPKDELKAFPWNEQSYTTWRTQNQNAPEYTELQPLECCGDNQCWSGFGCVDSQHDTPQRDLYPDGYACILGDWVQQEIKLQWDRNPQRQGFCERNTQCLVSVFGDAANNDDVSAFDADTWNVPGQDSGPQCISAGQYIGDHYCEGVVDGNNNVVDARWTTRTKQLAGFFLQKVRTHPFFENQRAIADYSIYCDEYANALNNVDYYPVEQVDQSPFVAGATAELVYLQGIGTEYLGGQHPLRLCDNNPDKTCVNNFCVMRWTENGNNKTAFGVSVNTPINTPGHGFLAALGEQLNACDNLQATDTFQECNGKFDSNQLWFNPVSNTLVFAPEGMTPPNHPQTNRLINWLAQYIPGLERWASTIESRAGGVDYDFAGNVESFNFFYESAVSNDTGDVDKLVQVVKEENVYSASMGSAEDFLAARFTNFDADICATLEGVQRQTEPNAAYTCVAAGTSYEIIAHNSQQNSLIYDRWQDLTARLRLQKATPPCTTDNQCNGYFNPLCPDGDPDFDANNGDSCCRIKEIDEFGETVYYRDGELIVPFDGTQPWAHSDNDCPACLRNSDCNDNDGSTIDTCEDVNGRLACVNTPITACSGSLPDSVCPTGCTEEVDDSSFDVDCL